MSIFVTILQVIIGLGCALASYHLVVNGYHQIIFDCVVSESVCVCVCMCARTLTCEWVCARVIMSTCACI